MRISGAAEQMSERAARWSGSTDAFVVAAVAIAVWAASGPLFHYSDAWQLTVNTATTTVTFLMVFLIQRSQNKAALALQLKLNEIVAALQGASNRLIEAETFSERDLETLRKHYEQLAKLATRDRDVTQSHSVEDARARQTRKPRKRRAE